jgi:hypothetical protein
MRARSAKQASLDCRSARTSSASIAVDGPCPLIVAGMLSSITSLAIGPGPLSSKRAAGRADLAFDFLVARYSGLLRLDPLNSFYFSRTRVITA